MRLGKFEFSVSEHELGEGDDPDDDYHVAYLKLPDHPAPDTVIKKIQMARLQDLMQYEGADIYFEFDENRRLIGIEILAEK